MEAQLKHSLSQNVKFKKLQPAYLVIFKSQHHSKLKKTFEMFEIFQSRLFPSSRPSKLDYPRCFSSHYKNSTSNSVKITVSMLKHIQMRCERGQLVTFIPIHLSFLTLFFFKLRNNRTVKISSSTKYSIVDLWRFL